MRPAWNKRTQKGNYRCLARDRGYFHCEQSSVLADDIDVQVREALFSLEIPIGYRDRVEAAVQQRVENAEAIRRIEEIKEIVKRVDISWEKGFIELEAYVEKRKQLQREIEALRPIDYDNLMNAADILNNISDYWTKCEQTENPIKARQDLIAQIIDRVYIYDKQVIAIALHGDYRIILDADTTAPDDMMTRLNEVIKMGVNTLESAYTQNGSDGIRTRDLHLDRVAC